MYYFKKDVVNVYNQSAIARQVGITVETMCRIFNRKQGCSKMTAYCIVKTIHPESEIEDFFEYVKKKGE